ncbi:MAG: HDOD domain-containing protein [Planctomycetota bacterium]
MVRSPESERRQVELILAQIDALPTLSPVAARLLSVGSAEDADIDEVVKLIESDPSLTATLLGLCRKSTTGLGTKVDSVKRAVVLLGFEAVRTAALSAVVFEQMQEQSEHADRAPREADEPRVDRVGLWKHAAAVACAAEIIAAEASHLRVPPERAFIAGLLHDIGRVVLESILPRATARVASLAERRAEESASVERKVLGIDHFSAGERLAARWELPVFLSSVIAQHSRSPGTTTVVEDRALVGIVTCAKAMCRDRHLGWSGDFGTPPDAMLWLRELELPEALLEEIGPRVLEATADRWSVLRLDDQTTPEMLADAVTVANQRLATMNRALLDRTAESAGRGKALRAIAAFQSSWRQGQGAIETIEKVVASAAAVLGEGYWAAVHQSATSRDWQVFEFTKRGKLVRSTAVERPGDAERRLSLAHLSESGDVPLRTPEILAALRDGLESKPDLDQLRAISLSIEGMDAGTLLLHDRSSRPLQGDSWVALKNVWSAAVREAEAADTTRRASEQQSELTRALEDARDQLSRAAVMTMLGGLTAGAAHELGTPLAVAKGRSQRLLASTRDDAVSADAKAIVAAVERMDELVSNLRLLAEPPTPKTDPLDVDELLRDAVGHAAERSEPAGHAQVKTRVMEEDLTVTGDRKLLTASLSELIQNAAEAAPGPQIEITAERDALDGRVLISVRDFGPGLSARARKHAFDPFFSEKPAGRRTGLGLTRARRLVEVQGGELSLQSPPGGGVRAVVLMPVAAAVTDEQAGESPDVLRAA